MKPSPGQITIPSHNYSCTACGKCCRLWHVYLLPEDKRKLAGMEFTDDPDVPENLTTWINGHEYLAHRESGACIFLDEETNYCKIHSKYGYDEKPLGCRVYPYTITTTFPNQFGVTARFDCPAVRDNDGRPLAQEMTTIRGYIDEMGLSGGFDENVLDEMSAKTIHKLTETIFREIIGKRDMPQMARMKAAIMALDRLEIMGSYFLDSMDLDEIFPSFFERVRTDLEHQQTRRLGMVEQWRFLTLLSGYLRRDEELVGKGALARAKRTKAMAGIFFGKGKLHTMGETHPNLEVDRKKLFGMPIENLDDIDWGLYMDLVKVRMQAFQFLGPSNYNLSYFVGLRSLFMTFPLVLAVAKASALSRDNTNCVITPDDVDFAIGAVDHSFGRSAFISMGMFTTFTRQMTEPPNYLRLIAALSG